MSTATCSGTAIHHERLLADLTDAALRVAARHKVGGVSVDHELDFWHALMDASKDFGHAARKIFPTTNDRLAALADAAYRAALGHGIPGAFSAFELELWEAFRAVASAFRTGRPDKAIYVKC